MDNHDRSGSSTAKGMVERIPIPYKINIQDKIKTDIRSKIEMLEYHVILCQI